MRVTPAVPSWLALADCESDTDALEALRGCAAGAGVLARVNTADDCTGTDGCGAASDGDGGGREMEVEVELEV